MRSIDQLICISDDGNKLSNEIIVCLTVLIRVDRAPGNIINNYVITSIHCKYYLYKIKTVNYIPNNCPHHLNSPGPVSENLWDMLRFLSRSSFF